MLFEKDKLKDIFEHMKQKVQATEGSVLICVAGEIDAMAAGHILTVYSWTPRLFFYTICCYVHCCAAQGTYNINEIRARS